MEVVCPGCKRMLRVPDGSVGRRARCPACQEKFVVASPHDQMEATVSGWIVEDIESSKAAQERHRTILGR